MKGFFSRPLGLWIITLTAAAGLLAVGYLVAHERLRPKLYAARKQAAEQASRANRLAAENRMLESRLTRRLSQVPPPSTGAAVQGKEAQKPVVQSRVLRKGRAVLVLDGRVSLSLESLSPKNRKAAIRVQVLGGKEGTAVLGLGGSVGIKLDGAVHYLVVKAVHSSSVVFSLVSK